MRNLKNLLIFALVGLIFAGCGFGKMIPRYPDITMQLENPDLENKGGKVEYTVKGTVPPKYLKKKASMLIEVPVVAQDNMQNPVSFNTIKLVGEKSKEQGTRISWKNGGKFSTSGSFDFNPNYEDQNIYAKSTATLGKKTHEFPAVLLGVGIANTSSRVGINPTLSDAADKNKIGESNGTLLLFAPHDYKDESISQVADIYFEVNTSTLNWGLKLNRDKAAKQVITDFNNFLMQVLEEGRGVKKVAISGWASPEGEESLNQGLSEKRYEQGKKWFEQQLTTTVRNYARKHKMKVKDVVVPEIVFDNQAKGEDWQGFETAVENSTIAEKNKILNVVRSQPNDNLREQRIREMTDIYQEIADIILPPLRRVEIDLVCNKHLYTDAQLKELVKGDSVKLSLNERLYAASLYSDLTDKEVIYTAIVNDAELQNDWRAYNNLAILAINKYIAAGDAAQLSVAANNLEKAQAISPNNGIIFNNLAILNFLNNNITEARANFEKSITASSYPVNQDYNMGMFKILDGDYVGADALMKNRSCEYSVALLQLLNKDYAAAKNTLACTPKDAKAYYLMAILAARTQNEAEVYTYLEKAVSLDASYKAAAKKDAEFKKYKKSEQFKNIVK